MIPYLTIDWNFQDNLISSYRRACNIFVPKSELVSFLWTFVISVRNTDFILGRSLSWFSSPLVQLHIWDFSGQTIQFLMDNRINLPNDILGEHGKEVTDLFICLSYILLLLLRLLGNVIHDCFLSIDVQFCLLQCIV
jgi:hypothetical protein